MKKKILSTLYDYIIMTIGVLIFTISWEAFMNPNGMSAGGLMGLSTVIEFATGGAIKAYTSYVVINSALILLAIIAFGIGFGFKTIYAIAMSTVMLWVVDGCDWMHAVEGNFMYVPERIMIPIIAGILEAVGVGLIIRRGGSTGGTDIIALIVNKYWPISLSKMFLITDMVIVTSVLFVPGKTFADMIYGYIMMVSFALTIDYVVVGDKGSIQLMIFSTKYKEIADYINTKLDRGVTVLKAQGWYTKAERNVLLILLRRNELQSLTKTVKELDSKAFMSVNQVGGVYGEGFEEIKVGLTKKKKQDGNA